MVAALEKYRAACRTHKKSAGLHVIRPNEANVRRALDEGTPCSRSASTTSSSSKARAPPSRPPGADLCRRLGPALPLEQRVARFRRFYQRANERPLLGFFVGSDYPLRRYRASDALPSDRPLTPEDFAVAPYLDDCDRLFALHEACGGDFI